MSLSPGARLGPYEVTGPLGAGGMGEVYKARDTRLDRTVAIKVLPAQFAADPRFRERFEREAKAISQLSHPHICVLHDVGRQDEIDYLVMEYLEGQTLAQRLYKGALPLDQALRYAVQIADALDRAHRQGIVHRDLKPGNIMLTKSGAKLLDFGLAKAGGRAITGSSSSMLPSTVPMTVQGTILGTLQYMAPEQLEGKEADSRSDIFSFGAIIYEMTTGKRAFEGNSAATVIAAIVDRQLPPMSTLQPLTPPMLDRVATKCLAKNPDDRWQTAHDLSDELRWIAEHERHPIAGAVQRLRGMRTKYRFAAFELDLDRGSLIQDGREVALRPKTFHVLRHLVVHHGKLVSKDDLTTAVWTDTAVTDNSLSQCLFEIRRALGDESQSIIRTVARRGYVFDAPIEPDEPTGDASRLPPAAERPADLGMEPDRAPGISARPAERRRPWRVLAAGLALTIGLGALAAWRISRPAATADEAPLQLTNFPDSVVSPSLSRDGRLLAFVRGGSFGTMGSGPRGQVYVKHLPSAEPVRLTDDLASKYFPVFSPDDSTLIYTRLGAGLSWDTWQVPVLRGTPQPFLKNASGTTWLDKDRLIYSTIMAGAGVHMGIARSTASRDDYVEIYFPARKDGMAHRSAASPDKRSLLVVEMVGGTWTPCRLIPLEGSSIGRRVGPQEGQCTSAAWSPDGRWMYFSSNSGGAFHIWRQRYPEGKPEQITFGPTEQEGTAITTDGQYLITSMGLQQSSLWLGGRDGERLLTTERYVTQPSIDPSGRVLHYVSRTDASRGQTSGELWSLDLQSGRRRAVLPGMVVTNYSLSRDGRSLLFTSAGAKGGDGVWVVDAARDAPPRRLIQGTDLRAFFTSPDEFVYTSDDNRLHRMKVDGSGDSVVSREPVDYLSAVSPDGRWAVVIRPSGGKDLFTKLEFMSVDGGRSFTVCNDDCTVGPRSFLGAHPFAWSHDGSRMVVNLMHFGNAASRRSVSLPYNHTASPEQLWPYGLRVEQDILKTPGAMVINAPAVIPGPTADSFIAWRTSTLSNLYRIRIPDER